MSLSDTVIPRNLHQNTILQKIKVEVCMKFHKMSEDTNPPFGLKEVYAVNVNIGTLLKGFRRLLPAVMGMSKKKSIPNTGGKATPGMASNDPKTTHTEKQPNRWWAILRCMALNCNLRPQPFFGKMYLSRVSCDPGRVVHSTLEAPGVSGYAEMQPTQGHALNALL